MDTRVERKKQQKKRKRNFFLKLIIILFTLSIFLSGIKVVNANIVHLDYFKDPVIFSVNLKERKLYFFGESYLIDLKIFKKNY
ncbi:hypothetical protein [Schnuerera sp.]|uniref:hypothetical protein n=1 Tax=Schnuerera sp. TaxID=2794844 RepID=UPI002CA9CE50|nr:hypothetical protein [Schnuerera sp.]HSH34722.1 hypothetical protein [Schnuerera sp.]